MAFRTWGRLLLATLVAGVLAGAGQLGLAYGLGLVRFARVFDPAVANQWPAQLAWVTWFAMVAATTGALVADRLARRQGLPRTPASAATLAAAAAVGALAVAPLAMQPARAAEIAGVDPVSSAGWSALLGCVVGFLAALAALRERLVALNIVAVGGAVWLLALLAVAPSLGPTDPLPSVRLGVPDVPWLGTGAAQRLAVVTMPAVALVAGAACGALGRWRGRPMLVVATSGIAGPAMLALAYLVAGPGGQVDRYQAAPYWGALIGAAAGGLGSLLAVLVRRPQPAGTGDGPLEPTEILVRTGDRAVAEEDRAAAGQGSTGGEPADRRAAAATATTGPSDGTPATDPAGGTPVPDPRPSWTPARRPTTADFWPAGSATEDEQRTGVAAPAAKQPSSVSAQDGEQQTGGSAPAAGRMNRPDRPADVTTDPASPGADPLAVPAGGSWNAFTVSERRPRTDQPPGRTPDRAGFDAAPAPRQDRTSDLPPTSVPDRDRTPDPAAVDAQAADPAPVPADPTLPRSADPAPATPAGDRRRFLRRHRRSGEPPNTGSPETPATGDTGTTRTGPVDDDAAGGTDDAGTGVPRQRRARGRGKQDVPARDEEYVDWVAGLSGPAPKHDSRDADTPRRSLRRPTSGSTGPD